LDLAKDNKEIKNVENGYLGASDIVNGAAPFYKIEEKEMESALKKIYEEIGVKDME
jgi:hypothetical protein